MSSYSIQADLLKEYISRIENLEEEKVKVQEDLKEVYANAKEHGFDTKILKQIVKLRKMDDDEMLEQAEILEIYKRALGMVTIDE